MSSELQERMAAWVRSIYREVDSELWGEIDNIDDGQRVSLSLCGVDLKQLRDLYRELDTDSTIPPEMTEDESKAWCDHVIKTLNAGGPLVEEMTASMHRYLTQRDVVDVVRLAESPTYGFESVNGIPFLARLVREGDRWGHDDCFVWRNYIPMIQFYDTRYRHTRYGQHVSEYLLTTFMNTRGGLCLRGGEANWSISSQDVKGVFKWLERLDLDGYRRSGR